MPALASLSAIVSGMRSPPSTGITMTNCPAWCARAISGAFTRNSTMRGSSASQTFFSRISNMALSSPYQF